MDWRVSLYTWTKGIAAGAWLVPALLLLAGALAPASRLWAWAALVVAGVFLAATGALLVADLDHPERFTMVLTRPQWRSWLARGGVLISGYGSVLSLHFLGSALGLPAIPRALVWAGVPLAVLSAVYTAWLFAQTKARDLWQSPLLPPILLLQALLAARRPSLSSGRSWSPRRSPPSFGSPRRRLLRRTSAQALHGRMSPLNRYRSGGGM